MSNEELLALAKQSLSIMDSSTIKDNEINMWIQSAIADMKRQGIDVDSNLDDCLVQGTIIMNVKGNFGMTDLDEKKQALNCYDSLVKNLSLSSKYKLEEE